MIESENKRVERLVGLFVFLGLVMAGALIVAFGKFEDRFRSQYDLTVTFSEASGLVARADVRLGGAKIGTVGSRPRLNKTLDGVDVHLRIYDGVRLLRGSRFSIARSGLLGDAYVSIRPPEERPEVEDFHAPGDLIQGSTEPGLGDLQASALEISRKINIAIDDLQETLASVKSTLERVDKELLSEDNVSRVSDTLENMKTASGKFSEASEKMEPFLDEGKEALAKAKETFEKTSSLIDELKPAVEGLSKLDLILTELQPAVGELRTTIKTSGDFLRELQDGDGLLPALLHDPELKQDATVFISNLRRRGILFYKDNASATGDDDAGRESGAGSIFRRPAQKRRPHGR